MPNQDEFIQRQREITALRKSYEERVSDSDPANTAEKMIKLMAIDLLEAEVAIDHESEQRMYYQDLCNRMGQEIEKIYLDMDAPCEIKIGTHEDPSTELPERLISLGRVLRVATTFVLAVKQAPHLKELDVGLLRGLKRAVWLGDKAVAALPFKKLRSDQTEEPDIKLVGGNDA